MDSNSHESTLVIIPALNEEGAIDQVVRQVFQALPAAHVVVIDDGSHDQTAAVAQAAGAFVVRHPFNLGIGGAVQTGLKFACLHPHTCHPYHYIFRMDGDGQHNGHELLPMLVALQNGRADMVIGTRFMHSDGLQHDVDWHIPLTRRLGIRLYAWEVTRITGQRFTDTTSGFWGMNQRAAQILATYLPQDYPDVESRIIIHKAGLKQIELPVQMYKRSSGNSSINLSRSLYYAFKVTVAVMTTALKQYSFEEVKI